MIFGFGRQPSLPPPRKRGRFLAADIHRPRGRQRDVLEHAAPAPLSVHAHPKRRMRDGVVLAPLPAGVGPPLWRAIPAGVHELEVLRVGDAVHVDLERAHVDDVRAELVVPAKGDRGAIGAERRLRRPES